MTACPPQVPAGPPRAAPAPRSRRPSPICQAAVAGRAARGCPRRTPARRPRNAGRTAPTTRSAAGFSGRPVAFQAADRLVGVQAHDEAVPQRPGRLEQADVPGVQHVEAAACRHHRAAGRVNPARQRDRVGQRARRGARAFVRAAGAEPAAAVPGGRLPTPPRRGSLTRTGSRSPPPRTAARRGTGRSRPQPRTCPRRRRCPRRARAGPGRSGGPGCPGRAACRVAPGSRPRRPPATG